MPKLDTPGEFSDAFSVDPEIEAFGANPSHCVCVIRSNITRSPAQAQLKPPWLYSAAVGTMTSSLCYRELTE